MLECRLQELLDAKHLRQSDVSKNVEIDQTQLSRVCRGKADIRMSSIIRIMEYVKPTPDELYRLVMGRAYDE